MSSGNFLFFLLMFIGPFVTLSSSTWVFCWVGVELSFMGLIPLIVSDSGLFSMNKESVMKYFCIQALGSGLLMCSGIFIFFNMTWYSSVMETLFFLSLILKLGVFPMHFWVPSVISGLSFIGVFLVSTWQKIAPMILMLNFINNSLLFCNLALILGGLSAVVGSMIGLNQTKVLPMLAASSISHMGWIMIGLVYGGVWAYFFIYSLNFLILVFYLFLKENLYSGMMILSLSGLPPFFMFIGKWWILVNALNSSFSYWFLVLPVLGSIISLFFYLKFFYSFYMLDKFFNGFNFSMFVCISFLMFSGVFMVWSF